jgi:hypothetical protein
LAFISSLLPALLGVLVEVASAQTINPCPFSYLPCAQGGSEGIGEYLSDIVFPAMRIVFVAGALANFFFYAFRMLYQANDEEATKTAKGGYEQAIYGCAYMSLASFFVEAFGSSARSTLVNPEPLVSAFTNVTLYIKLIIAALVTTVLVIVAFRLVLVQDEGERDKAKKRLTACFLGVVVITIANVLVSAFSPDAGAAVLSAEIVGMANFLLTIFGALAVLWFVAAGIILVISVSEDQKDTAKKGLFTAVIAISVVLSSYVLLNFFLSL